MAYQKTDWKDGDVITKERMNNIEAGVAAAVTRTFTQMNLTTGANGRVNGGTVTFDDGSTFQVTINIQEGGV